MALSLMKSLKWFQNLYEQKGRHLARSLIGEQIERPPPIAWKRTLFLLRLTGLNVENSQIVQPLF